MTDHRFAHRALDARIDTLVETVRTLACLMQEATRWSAIHARNEGWSDSARAYASINRRLAEVIADELTWPEDKEPSDAFGEPA